MTGRGLATGTRGVGDALISDAGRTLRRECFGASSAGQGFGFARCSAQQGFTFCKRSAQQGFTLIELLIALMIFAMISAAGVLLLGNAVSAQGAVKQHLEAQGDMARIIGLIDQDMALAVPRISRTENGLLAPAFFSRPSSAQEPFLQFVRGGWTNIDGAPRASVQKVEYWFRDGRFERRGYPMVDGATGEEPALLMQGVASLDIAFRDDQGQWLDVWQQKQPDALPRAMRIILTMEGKAPLTLLLRVGTGAKLRDEAQAGNIAADTPAENESE